MRTIICKECGKVIEGLTINQADYQMRQHKMAKHEEVFLEELNASSKNEADALNNRKEEKNGIHR